MKNRPPLRKGNVPTDVLKLEAAQGRCPEGHKLPHRTERGRCTPVHCAGHSAGANSRQPVAERKATSVESPRTNSALKASQKEVLAQLNSMADAIIDKMLPGDTIEMQAARAAAKAQKVEELQKLGHQVGRLSALRAIYSAPEGLQGAAAEEYFKREAENLLPDIIVDLKRDLQLGDDTVRREARRDILDIVGKRKIDAAPNVHAAFLLVNPNGGSVINVPWSKKGAKTHIVNTTAKQLPEGPEGAKAPEGSKE